MEIKEEPIDFVENEIIIATSEDNNEKNKSKLSSIFETSLRAEHRYLENVENVLNSNNDEDYQFLIESQLQHSSSAALNRINSNENNLTRAININEKDLKKATKLANQSKLNNSLPSNHNSSITDLYQTENESMDSNINSKKKSQKEQHQLEKLVIDKKKILNTVIESAKEMKIDPLIATSTKYEHFNLNEENRILFKMKKLLSDLDNSDLNLNDPNLTPERIFAYRRFKTKIELRKLKRLKHLKLFDIDSYVNELIDREKLYLREAKILKKDQQNDFINPSNFISRQDNRNEFYNEGNAAGADSGAALVDDDDDIIFETETLKTSINENDNSGCEIIAITRVLDRFKTSTKKNYFNHYISADTDFFKYLNIMPIGIVESRFDDIKCVLSPHTNKVLKPYVRRDYESLPNKLSLNLEIAKRYCLSNALDDRCSIDYVHLRPEHVIPINIMCEQHFWSGIDISECLNYPDYTLVALYKKLIVGFAFMVPNVSSNESYLSFILVHHDWRSSSSSKNVENNIPIAHYMLYYLIQINPSTDLTLHVSVNSSAVLFYQKFGFKIEEFIKNFYDKYYSYTQNLSKDAFLMRLSKT